MISRTLASLLVCLPVALPSLLRAGDWTEFRGPTGQGLVDVHGLPVEWGTEKNVVWKVEVPGKGWSSPVVLGEKVYLTTAVPKAGEGQELRLLCLDAKSGSTIFNKLVFEQAAARIHGKNSHASPTPVTDGKHVFVHFGTFGTACLDLLGEIVWKTTEIKYAPVHGNGGSPVLVEGKLIFSCDGGDTAFVIALDQKTGDVVWQKSRPKTEGNTFAFCTPLRVEVEGRTQIVSPGAGWVVAYDPKDGEEIWRVQYKGGYSVVPRPVYGHGMIYLSSGYNTPIVMAIKPNGKGDVTETHVAWKYSRSGPRNASPILVGDELYVCSDNGILTCLDARSGDQVWQKRLGGDYSSSPVFSDGKLYFQNETGEGVVIEAGKTFKEVARNKLDERSLASYAVIDKSFLIRTEKHLYRVGQ